MLDVHTAAHWPCGTPRSQGNAFDIPRTGDTAKTKSAKRYDKKLAAQGRSRLDTAKTKAMRVNPESSLAAFIPNSTKAPR